MLSIALGVFVSPVCYALAVISLPFFYVGEKSLKNLKLSKAAELTKESIRRSITEKTGKNVGDNELLPVLTALKIEACTKKSERERIAASVKQGKEMSLMLSDEIAKFFSGFEIISNDPFGEIRERIANYEALLSETEAREEEAQVYAREKGLDRNADIQIDTDISFEEALRNLSLSVRAFQSERTAAEVKISALYDDISREDELQEQRFELLDTLAAAEFQHKVALKTSQHLSLAKERLTSKYLGKMLSAFDFYISDIAKENTAAFALDTDFSLKKTENGLTNPAESYSLGTKELYSIATRLALVDALYEKNQPFIILDDPFCHLDDSKCESALSAISSIAANKQIIYLTCSNSRTPKR